MKTSLFRYGLGLLVSALLLTSCETKFPEYKLTNDDVSWESEGITYALDVDETPITIKLQRGVANEAVTVPITFDDALGAYSISATQVSFAVGEYVKTIELTYNYSSLVPGTEYKFTLKIPESQAGAGCFFEFDGNGMMQLQYEDYLDGFYPQTLAYGGGLHKWRDGAFVEELDGTDVKLMKAKGTDNYYKLIWFKGDELEFKAKPDGSVEIKKYAGYNDIISRVVSATEVYIPANKISNDSYLLDCRIDYSFLEDAGGSDLTRVNIIAGDKFYLYAWTQKNGSWMNGGYALFHIVEFK